MFIFWPFKLKALKILFDKESLLLFVVGGSTERKDCRMMVGSYIMHAYVHNKRLLKQFRVTIVITL